GIHFFDSDAYPQEYREKLYMGNIHGGCINCDELTRDGSTYFAKPRPDFLTANDAWFMPVVQKTGPDGCLYILDWYDRYHCYQDAGRDPKGIDREKGRLYRVRYNPSPQHSPPGGEGRVRGPGLFDLGKESDEQLIRRLHSPNVYFRDIAQRLLCERNNPATRPQLQKLILDDSAPRKARMHALWALVGTGSLETDFHLRLLQHGDAGYRAWGVRVAGNFDKVDAAIGDRVVSLAKDASPDVQLQVAIAARKIEGVDAVAVLLDVLKACGDDKLIPTIVWQNLHPLLEEQADQFAELAERPEMRESAHLGLLMPRVVERVLARERPLTPKLLRSLVAALGGKLNQPALARCLAVVAGKVESGEIGGEQLSGLRETLKRIAAPMVTSGDSGNPVYFDAAVLLAALKEPQGVQVVRELAAAK